MALLTRSNHVEIAKIIRNTVEDRQTRIALCNAFVKYFTKNNQWFDKKRFIAIISEELE